MCAGVYLDPEFRDLVLRRVYCDRNRRVAPSYGFSLIPVIVHAWRAWRLELAQHLIVLAIFVVAGFWAWPAAAIAGSALILLYLERRLLPLTGDFTAYYLGRRSSMELAQMRRRRDLLQAFVLLFGGVVLVAIMAGFRKGIPGLRTGILTGRLPWPLWVARSGLGGAALTLMLVAATVALISAMRQMSLNRLHYDNGRGYRTRGGRLATIRAQQEHPFTVYSGFVPFIGSGSTVLTWSFAQRLIPKPSPGHDTDREYPTPPFRVQDLVEHLKEMIEGLRDEENPETRLPGLSVADHVLVEGTRAFPYLPVLRGKPSDAVVRDKVTELIAHSSDAARHYLACQVESWGGEIVTTVFVHVSLQGRTLYLEFSTYALLPTRREYHIIDEVGETGPAAVMRAVGKGLTGLPDVLFGLRRLTRVPAEIVVVVQARRDKTVRARRGVNIGALVSVREETMESTGESYFQFRDIVQHSKIIERRLIASVGGFLKDHGVDTSEFLQRANTILNTGVYISAAGAVTVTGSAIGNQASVGGEPTAPPDAGA